MAGPHAHPIIWILTEVRMGLWWLIPSSEPIEYVGEGLVFVGVLLEVLCERKLILKSNNPQRDRLEGIGGWALIFGLAVSLAALVGTNEHFNTTIADLNLKAEQAKASVALANERRVELENRVVNIFGPRQLTTAQSALIAEKLVGLKTARIDVFVVDPGNSFTSSDDSIALGRKFVDTLRAAKISASEWLLTDCASGMQALNVSVITLPDGKYRPIALRIRNAFASEIAMASGVGDVIPYCTTLTSLDKGSPHRRWAGANKSTIAIAIGRKVQPILTREMLEPKNDLSR